MFGSKVKKKDILNDSSIKTISAENIDKDSENIKVILDVSPSRKKTIVKLIMFFSTIGLLMFLIISGIILFLNTTFVQGDVEGSLFEIAGFSIVDNNYNPTQYLAAGKSIYYDNETGGVILSSSAFKKGKVAKISNNHVYLEGEFKNLVININEIDYVLKESA